jgi:hypothetical protein
MSPRLPTLQILAPLMRLPGGHAAGRQPF